MDKNLIGTSSSATTIVSEKNTAKTVGSGTLEVFSTPMMVALMEEAACLGMVSLLSDGQTSVGTQISVSHVAASKLGNTINASATITKIDGKSVEFDVIAFDGDTKIGFGTHTRFIVNEAKFMSRL